MAEAGNAMEMVRAAGPTKNNDCYFYYYSTCTKGDDCPYRHEPAALRNETMCLYWLRGHCTKENCIFRHMEITKQRGREPCYFESQPGGCRKPHCPFIHQNILDHPREEDALKNPDLILPVKTNSAANPVTTTTTPTTKELPQTTPSLPPPAPPSPPYVQPMNSIIVPLQDGESDSESPAGTPHKAPPPPQRPDSWELQRLREIQLREAALLGYSLESADEEVVVEEVVEMEDDTSDAAHHRLTLPDAAHHRLTLPTPTPTASLLPPGDLRALLTRPSRRDTPEDTNSEQGLEEGINVREESDTILARPTGKVEFDVNPENDSLGKVRQIEVDVGRIEVNVAPKSNSSRRDRLAGRLGKLKRDKGEGKGRKEILAGRLVKKEDDDSVQHRTLTGRIGKKGKEDLAERGLLSSRVGKRMGSGKGGLAARALAHLLGGSEGRQEARGTKVREQSDRITKRKERSLKSGKLPQNLPCPTQKKGPGGVKQRLSRPAASHSPPPRSGSTTTALPHHTPTSTPSLKKTSSTLSSRLRPVSLSNKQSAALPRRTSSSLSKKQGATQPHRTPKSPSRKLSAAPSRRTPTSPSNKSSAALPHRTPTSPHSTKQNPVSSTDQLDFKVKSLADIKAEKKGGAIVPTFPSSTASTNHPTTSQTQNGASRGKRSHSPITFTSRKLRRSSPAPSSLTTTTTTSTVATTTTNRKIPSKTSPAIPTTRGTTSHHPSIASTNFPSRRTNPNPHTNTNTSSSYLGEGEHDFEGDLEEALLLEGSMLEVEDDLEEELLL
ncbi:hypothetical protein Pmani_027494 [Petrolisthes manimaculis]|uniref:C3H1-type domain-containing protein n=1 Tax=Petrolisthes manimaculis TaxID=1843537 RepID=A0AAE1P1C0_9EUCA|nr:hypothetical protein Pmani_027494 [Petrolisthes manimaculis]